MTKPQKILFISCLPFHLNDYFKKMNKKQIHYIVFLNANNRKELITKKLNMMDIKGYKQN